jgi:hypothetical protein
MKLRSTQAWTPAKGPRRRIRLFEAYCNMLGRCRGTKSKDPGKYWNAGNEFESWAQFRQWALANGYRKGVELDRIDSSKPYRPENCQWLTTLEHRRKTAKAHKPTCKCNLCGYSVRHAARSSSVTWTPREDGVPF